MTQGIDRKPIVMIHANPARIEGNLLTVDRKFHVGMLRYAELIRSPIVTINPPLSAGQQIMDQVEISLAELPYGIQTTVDPGRTVPAIKGARLVYGYENSMQAATIAREHGVPYIMILEYDLQTKMTETASRVANPLRRVIRRARSAAHYFRKLLPEVRRAHSLHCNGYPIFEAMAPYNENRLLYLDSRMSADMLITDEELKARLDNQGGRPLSLLYSGRYEPMKGALDAVKVGLECIRRGLPIEMHCYGQGSQMVAMSRLAAESPIKVHPAIPYPELVKISHSFDAFVCCHIQNDPSCTYLESMGAGLPIVGYDNRMWNGVLNASSAGYASPMHRPGRVADGVAALSHPAQLRNLSERALAFAKSHTFERETQKRVDAINSAAET
jgi:colanic acid/amylovoran biosynthesis glycosyltransferase